MAFIFNAYSQHTRTIINNAYINTPFKTVLTAFYPHAGFVQVLWKEWQSLAHFFIPILKWVWVWNVIIVELLKGLLVDYLIGIVLSW